MKVYCVQGLDGWVYAIFNSEEDAEMHRSSCPVVVRIVERTVFTGQAKNPGYNR